MGKKSEILRPDVVDKATGRAKFTFDVQLNAMLYGKILRSPHPHARIKSVNTTLAESIPGVIAIITGADYDKIGGCYGAIISDEKALHSDKVRYCGDEIAAVAAITEEIAKKAVKAIEVEYELLPAVLNVEDALKQKAPVLHEDLGSNIRKNVLLKVGDVEKAKAESAYIASADYETSRQQHVSMEPHCAVVDFDTYAGRMTVWSSAQAPYVTRLKLAGMFGIPESNVRIISEFVGGGFGSKCDSFFSTDVCAAMLSQRTGRPVKVVNSREEEMCATRTRHLIKRNTEMGFDKDGTITFIREKVLVDNGAYTSFSPGVTWLTAVTAIGPYKIENVLVDADIVYTNTVPGGAFRGFGNPQSTFARESLIDEAALALGIDPLELRMKNIVKDSDAPYINSTGQILKTFAAESCLREVSEKIRYHEKKHGEGIGLAAMIHWSTSRWEGMEDADNSNATVTVNDDGSVIAHLGYTEIGQGSHMTFRKIIADVLRITPQDIKLVQSNTDHTPLCQGTFGSRGSVIAGSALKIAALDARDQMISAAAHYFETNEADISVEENGNFAVRSQPEKQLKFSELAEKIYFSRQTGPSRMVIGRGSYEADTVYLSTSGGHYAPTYACAAVAVRLKVDERTGIVEVKQIASAHDVGIPLDIGGIEAQIQGGIAQGLGYALTEDTVYNKNGKIINDSLRDYIIPTFADMPGEIIPIVVTSGPAPDVPSGAKGVGETSMVCVAPAIANAIADATGKRIRKLPITPETILYCNTQHSKWSQIKWRIYND